MVRRTRTCPFLSSEYDPLSFPLASGAVSNLSGWEICWRNGESRYPGGRQKRTMTGTVTKAWDVTWEGGVGVGLARDFLGSGGWNSGCGPRTKKSHAWYHFMPRVPVSPYRSRINS